MAQRFTPPASWPTVGKVIELFCLMGDCEIKEGPHIVGPHDAYRIRFLYNPKTGETGNLGRLEDTDWMHPHEVEGLERSLGIAIPHNW